MYSMSERLCCGKSVQPYRLNSSCVFNYNELCNGMGHHAFHFSEQLFVLCMRSSNGDIVCKSLPSSQAMPKLRR